MKAKLIENTQSAVERGAFGVPTFFVGDEMFFGKDQLRERFEEMVAGSHRMDLIERSETHQMRATANEDERVPSLRDAAKSTHPTG